MTPPWLERKACRPEQAALFFPGGGEAPRGQGIDYGPALAICAQCPVVGPCRADAESHGDIVDGHTTHGQVVGGCAPPDRPRRASGQRYWSKLEPCGTVAAYKRHLRRGEPSCAPCREAERLAKKNARGKRAS